MPDWVPVSTSARGRLTIAALDAFGNLGYDAVNVVELASRARVTTGSLYHQFGSKAGLYAFVRHDVEQRILDRMEGAAAVVDTEGPARKVRATLLVAFDYATAQGFARLLGERNPGADDDPIEAFLARLVGPRRKALAPLVAATWRAALLMVAAGTPVASARRAFAAFGLDEDSLAVA
jgi:AcrR family transcriptional regulator